MLEALSEAKAENSYLYRTLETRLQAGHCRSTQGRDQNPHRLVLLQDIGYGLTMRCNVTYVP